MRVLLRVPHLRSLAAWVPLLGGAMVLGCPSDRGTAGAPGGVAGSSTDGSATTSTTASSGGSGGASAGGAPGGAGNGGAGAAGKDGGDDATTVVAAGVRFFGRVDTSDANAPRFAWTGAGFSARFSGTSVGLDLKNDDGYFFQVVIDGNKRERFQAAKGRAARTVATGLAGGSHTLELYREIEASYGVSQFFGLTEGTLEPPPPARGRLIEFVGDSITAGYGNLGNEPHPNYGNPSPCHFSFDTESAYMSYGAVTARALGAHASIVAASGWGVYRSRTGSTDDVLPKVYGRSLGMSLTDVWDFRTKPQAVVINLGTNDFSPGDPGEAYTMALGAFVDTIRTRHPTGWIFCAVGTMYNTTQHAKALSYAQSVVNGRGGDSGRVTVVDLGSQDALQGTGCDWHPSAAEDQRMADVLVPVLKQKLGW